MVVTNQHIEPEEEKEWEDPLHPAEPSDERDKEQIQKGSITKRNAAKTTLLKQIILIKRKKISYKI
jgi:hypothetical protein